MRLYLISFNKSKYNLELSKWHLHNRYFVNYESIFDDDYNNYFRILDLNLKKEESLLFEEDPSFDGIHLYYY